MTGFETYDISAWIRDGLAMHPVVTPVRTSNHLRRPSVATRMFLPAVAAGTLAFYAAKPVAQWFSDAPTRLVQSEMQGDLIPGEVATYWTDAVAALRSAARVEESGPADPPTHY
jgi:hypothetical protein